MNRGWIRMKKIKYLLLGLLVLIPAVLLSACSSKENDTSTGYISDEQRAAHIQELQGDNKVLKEDSYKKITRVQARELGITGIADMCKLMENSKFTFYFNFEDTAFAIYDKTTKKVYHSDPIKSNELSDQTVSISSPISLEAYDVMNKRYDFNFMQNCMEDKNFSVVDMGNKTIRIIYTIGNDPDKDLVPPVITKDTYDGIISELEKSNPGMIYHLKNCYREITPDKVDADIREAYGTYFPTIDYMTLYVCRDLNAKQKAYIKQSMEAAGFTVEDLKDEMERAEYQGPERAVMYTIPVDLTLQDDGLTVNVDAAKILAPGKQKLYKIYLYRGFAAIRGPINRPTAADEYMLIPDGSGTIMPVNGNVTTDVFTSRIYGADESFAPTVETVDQKRAAQILTSFAAYDRGENGSVMAILEEGGAQAFISARPFNGTSNLVATLNYDLVYSERDYRSYSSNSSADSSGSGVVLAKEDTKTNFRLRYILGEGGKTYAEYAQLYRQYLIDNEKLPAKTNSDAKTSLYVDLIGAFPKTESVVGVPVEKTKPLTTYEQAAEILNQLKNDGVKNVSARYSYWANGGYVYSVHNKVRLISELGTEQSLKQLVQDAKDSGYKLYPSAEFMYVIDDIVGDGFSYENDAARRLDMRTASVSDVRNLATGEQSADTAMKILVSPDLLPEIGASYKESLEKFLPDNSSISLGSIGRNLSSSYKTNRYVDRTKAVEYQTGLMDTYKDYNQMVEAGNDYTWNYATDILDLPMGSSEYDSTLGSIPFIQMVLHGYVSYSGAPANVGSDYKMTLLKSIETGSNVLFRWMGEEDTVFENTSYGKIFFSSNYKNSYDKAVALYKELSEQLDKVASLPITDHQTAVAYIKGVEAPEVIGEEDAAAEETPAESSELVGTGNVFITTYGDRYSVVVNYNSYDVVLEDGTVVEAENYIWR